jgi:hypothetical protein
MRVVLATILLAALASLAGCASRGVSPNAADYPAAPVLASATDRVGRGLSDMTVSEPVLADPVPYPPVEAMVAPPPGWQPDPIKTSSNHSHQVWLSPSGHTAYGVIRMNLPLPFIGPDRVLRPFLDEMRRSEGEAKLMSRQTDRRLPGPGIRFVAEGGLYTIRANLMTRGFRAWAVYAGTKRDAPEVGEELEQAEQARERTKIGLPRSRS